MQPTERKHKNDEELIAHIKHSLKTHEESYKLGAWEKFNKQQETKKSPVLWWVRLSGVAAILAICFSLIWFTTNKPESTALAKGKAPKNVASPKNEQLNNDPKSGHEQLDTEQPVVEGTTQNAVFASNNISKERSSIAKKDREALIAQEVMHSNNQVAVNVDQNTPPITKTTVSPQTDSQQALVNSDEKSKSNILDFLAGETKKGESKLDKLAMSKNQKKWELGLMLAPSFGNSKELNMGYGISMSYNFSERFSLNSGIAYNKMNASKNLPTNIGTSAIILGNTKSLEVINEEVTGIDIPLELKYNINKNMYANFGISGFAVLNQKRSNTFVEEVVVKSTSSSLANGTSDRDLLDAGPKGQFANSYIVNQRTTEQASPAAIDDVNYIGFYNLSFGYTKKIYKNHALSIEPFIKLPIKTVTRDNLNLVGTGLRLKVGF